MKGICFILISVQCKGCKEWRITGILLPRSLSQGGQIWTRSMFWPAGRTLFCILFFLLSRLCVVKPSVTLIHLTSVHPSVHL